MSSSAVTLPTYNVSIPALPNAVFSFVDEDAEESASWSPHPDLPDGIRNRVVEAVGRQPRTWLMPPKEGELFDSHTEGQARILGYSLVAGGKRSADSILTRRGRISGVSIMGIKQGMIGSCRIV
jgi:hypothetical protein